MTSADEDTDETEEAEAVGAGAETLLDGVLGVRHQTDDVATLVADARDVTHRAVGVDVDVACDDPVLPLDPVERALVGDEAALAVLEGYDDLLPDVVPRRPRGGGALDAEPLVPADEPLVVVADQRARQQVRLAQDLEAVADA